jgi:hypothetical protein
VDQEIRSQGFEAAFSQKSDIYAFGCILYRLVTLAQPAVLNDVKVSDIGAEYSIELLGLVCEMLSSEREDRLTAQQVKEKLVCIAEKLSTPAELKCGVCEGMFVSKNALRKHFNKAGHGRRDHDTKPAGDEQQITIRGAAHAPAPLQYHYDHAALDAPDPSPCVVCNKHFNTKRQFFAHLGGGQHWRSAKYVQKRKAEDGPGVGEEEKEGRFIKWMRKDMQKHD